jgi:peptidoglycan/LPS O-acetylase OafA/YrhL
MTKPHLRELTGARFIAAAIVMVGHFGGLSSIRFMRQFSVHSRAAVSFFFVLSGFVLALNYATFFSAGLTRRRVTEFWQARFARIYPVHLFILLLSVPLTLILLSQSTSFSTIAKHPTPSRLAISFALNALLLHVYSSEYWISQLWNSPSWSIATEAVFYLVFPFFAALVLPRFRSRHVLLIAGAVFYVASIVFTLSAMAWLHQYRPESEQWLMAEAVYKLPLFRIWEFFIGCCLGSLFLCGTPQIFCGRPAREVGLLLSFGWCGLVVIAARFGWSGDYLHWYILYIPAFAAIIMMLAWGPTSLTPILANPIAVLLGESSYSLYLLHVPIFRLLEIVHVRSSPSRWILGSGICILASICCYRWFETPVRKLLRPHRLKKNT